MTRPKETDRPEFEFYRKGIPDPDKIGSGLSRLPTTHFTSLVLGLVSAYAISPWSATEGWLGAMIAVMLMTLAVIHSVMVVRGNAKTTNKPKDDPPESGGVRSSERTS